VPRHPPATNYPRSTIRSVVPLLLSWFAANARDLPWRRTRDPYAIWVSEIMLQQTQVKTVLGYWERWMTALPTVEALAQARSQTIHKLWEGLGYYTRVRNLQKAAQQIVAHHAGQFPWNYDAILELPGIGRYTAGAIASIAFNEPRAILDGNVIRVLTRVFDIAGNPRDKAVNAQLWQLAQALVDRAFEDERAHPGIAATQQSSGFVFPRLRGSGGDGRGDRVNAELQTGAATSSPSPRDGGAGRGTGRGVARFSRGSISYHESPRACSALNQSLMELGALVCTPRQPKCPDCPLCAQCVARCTGRIASLPNLAARQTVTHRHFAAFVIEHRGRYLVRQRPDGTVNAHLWEFPNAEIDGFQLSDESAARTATKSPSSPTSGRTSPSPRDGGAGRGPGRGDTLMSRGSLSKLRQIAIAELGFPPGPLQRLCTLKHSITRYRLAVTVLRATLPSPAPTHARASRWLSLPQLRRLPFTAAHRRIIDQHL
jgi:adenine-specific DNA glycosylase